MLTEFIVRQFALIEEMQLELASGMTVFSGETGAGKSILVDALGAAFGARASQEWVRHGADKAEVMAVVEHDDARLHALLQEHEIESDEQLILRRVINADGRSRAWLNGMPVPLKVLQQVGNLCLDLHGQHEHQALLQAEFQKAMVDAGVADALQEQVTVAHADMQSARKALQRLQSDKGDAEQQENWMREELARLEAISPVLGLESELEQQVESGRHVVQIQQAAATALAVLDEDEPNARQMLASAIHAIEAMSEFNPGLKEAHDLLGQMDVLLGEAEPHLRTALDAELDPEALEQAEQRLAGLREAMRRHQTDEEGLVGLIQQWQERLSQLETAGWDAEKLTARLQETEAAYRNAASTLSESRSEAATKLAEALRPYLDRLGLKGMQIRIEVHAHEDESGQWHADGWDEIVFMAASNPGEPFRPLSQVASGGEMSRLVLALKACGALANAPHIAVFDEVDVGIGGETAWCVGELLQAMGHERQVLVVSHLPQVAACATRQVCIRKRQVGERTITELMPVAREERTGEIARMLGGASEEGLEHAAQMLARGSAIGAGA
jgi:DNA repair protein RecN (Recombination protein N)